MSQLKLYKEQDKLIDRPEKVDFKDKLQETISFLNEMELYVEFINIEDCYSNITKFNTIYGVYNLTITATNQLDVQVLEKLIEVCNKYGNPNKVIELLDKLLNLKFKI